jgi:protein-disulfide isomerase
LNQLRRQRLWQFGAAAIFGVILAAVVIVISNSGSSSLQHLGDDRAAVAKLFDGIPQNGQTLGAADAKATLLEFADLQCPFCRAFTLDTLPEVISRYVRPGKLRIRFEPQTVIGPQSADAARAALAAGQQNRLWQFTDLFYRNQDDENSGYITSAFINTLYENTPGLNLSRALNDLDAPGSENLLMRSQSLFRMYELNATPTFVLVRPNNEAQNLDAGNVLAALEQALGS